MPSIQHFNITNIVAPLIPYCDQESPDYHPELDRVLTGDPPYDFDIISTDELHKLRTDLLLVWLHTTNLGTEDPIIPLVNDVIQALPRVIPVTDEKKDQKRSFENNKAFLKKFGSMNQTHHSTGPPSAPSVHVAKAFLPPRQPQSDDKPLEVTPKPKR